MAPGAGTSLHPHPGRHARPWAWHPRVDSRGAAANAEERPHRASAPPRAIFGANSWMPGPSRADASLSAGDLELDVDVVARGVGIRTDLLVGFAGQRLERGLRQAL